MSMIVARVLHVSARVYLDD